MIPPSPPPLHSRRLAPLLSLACLPLVAAATAAFGDWPTYRANDARGGVSPDPLPDRVVEAWTWRSIHPPQPAWQGEAKWDGWNKVYNLKPRQIFDRAFHTVIADGRLFFGSSADDKVYCLDAESGRELWSFYTEGPVRLAPIVVGPRLYVGSDDGVVYCLDAATGDLVWTRRPVDSDRRIPGNGRIISNWPIRSSLLVRDGLAYTTAGMFPSEGVHLVALDADTGAVRWRQVQEDLPAQGYLLASATRLYVPSGRNNPVVCNLADGTRLQVVEGAGGTYALLTGDLLVFGPGKTGQLGAVEEGQKDQLASFQGNHMIVTPTRSYLHSDTELSALDRARYLDLSRQRRELASRQSRLARELRDLTRKEEDTTAAQARIKDQLTGIGLQLDAATAALETCVLWRSPCEHPLELILAGDSLVAGGEGEVAVFDTERGSVRWRHPVAGNAYGLAAVRGTLFVSTDDGVIHCLRAAPRQAALSHPQPEIR